MTKGLERCCNYSTVGKSEEATTLMLMHYTMVQNYSTVGKSEEATT